MYLALNAADMELFIAKKLSIFAIPAGKGEYHIGDTLQIKESFKKVTCHIYRRENGEVKPEDNIPGILYRLDGKVVLECGTVPPNNETYFSELEEASRWSSANQLPDYAVRYSAVISGIQEKSLSAFSDEDLKEFGLYYNEPQMLIEGFLPIKNHEHIYQWWKKRYKKTLKESTDPTAVILHLASL